MAGSPTPSRLGIPYGAATIEEGLKDVADLKSHDVHFIKVWVDDRVATVPKVKPEVYRAIIDQAHKNGQEVLAHLGQTNTWKIDRVYLRGKLVDRKGLQSKWQNAPAPPAPAGRGQQ